MVLRWCLSRSLLHGHRHAWDLHIDREESASGGEVKRFPIIAAKGDVGGGRLSVDDAAEFPAARIEDPSTHHRSSSMPPDSPRRVCRRRTSRSKTPVRRSSLNRWKTDCQGPKLCGRSRQGEPVRRIQSIPFTIVRGSRRGRPPPGPDGIRSRIASHSTSRSS